MNILVTVLDPFGGKKVNPAPETVRQLDPTTGAHITTALGVPTAFRKSEDVIQHELERHYYDVILSIGQAEGRFNITSERVGISIDYARIVDNKGNQPIDVVIHPDGTPAYFSNLLTKSMTEAIKKAGVPASLSNTTGTFVCNHVLHRLGYLTDKFCPNLLFGSIYVSPIPEQVIDKLNIPSLSLDTITKGITAATNVISDLPDVKVALGGTHQKTR